MMISKSISIYIQKMKPELECVLGGEKKKPKTKPGKRLCCGWVELPASFSRGKKKKKDH